MRQFLSRFLYVLQNKRKTLLLLNLLFLLVSALEALGTGLVGPFISMATNPATIQTSPWLSGLYHLLHFSSPQQFLLTWGGFVVIMFYIKAWVSFSAQKYIFAFSFSQQGEISSRLMKHYLAAPYTFHLSRNSAALIQNILNESYIFANGLMIPILTSICNLIIIIALVILLITTNSMAMVIIGGIVLLSYLIYQRFKDRLSAWGKEGSDSRTAMIRLINHGLGGLKETRVIGCEPYFAAQLDAEAMRYGRSASLAVSFSNLPRYLIEAFLITFLILFTFLFIRTNPGNPDQLSAVLGIFALASIRLLPAVGNLLTAINGIRYNSHSLDLLYQDLKELEQLDLSDSLRSLNIDSGSKKSSPSQPEVMRPGLQDPLRFSIPAPVQMEFGDRILLNQIRYRYPDSTADSLRGITLDIKKGESIGLIGKSGAGKTTLVDVILGLLTPQAGDIQVDGKSIYSNLRAWQNLIGYVPQSIFLIDDTLERNIAFGVPDPQINRDRLQSALRAAQLTELIQQLPDGLQTMVGEQGVMLSGGQRQRVGIARALYHEREILVFDEATAALDNETEFLVTEAIKALSGIKTMIIIAHRLSTLEHCDRIYRLEQGTVAESGSYREVILSKTL
jgi:ATP-binding cassette, subfamily B, bacterial PglK